VTTSNQNPVRASIQLRRGEGQKRNEVAVVGAGFPPGRVELLWDGEPLKEVKAGDKGGFRTAFKVPARGGRG
jgi:hypothetical protein